MSPILGRYHGGSLVVVRVGCGVLARCVLAVHVVLVVELVAELVVELTIVGKYWGWARSWGRVPVGLLRDQAR